MISGYTATFILLGKVAAAEKAVVDYNSLLIAGAFTVAGGLIAVLAQFVSNRHGNEAEDRRQWHKEYVDVVEKLFSESDIFLEASPIGGTPAQRAAQFQQLHSRLLARHALLVSLSKSLQIIGTKKMVASVNKLLEATRVIVEMAEAQRICTDIERRHVAEAKDGILRSTRKAVGANQKLYG